MKYVSDVKKYLFVLSLINILIFISCSTIKIRTYELDTPLLNENSSIKIVLISDLHSTIYGENQIELINIILEQKPDLIIMAGDILDDEIPNLGTELLLSGIKDIAPIYFVTGNHEYYNNNVEVNKELLRSYNVNILSDCYVKININDNEIILAGIEDSAKKNYDTPEYNLDEIMEYAFRELDEVELYKILIAHRPEKINIYKNFSFNLILSGHTHGGQVRIPPFINGLYAPDQGVFPKYAGGIYKHNGVIHIISRGLSVKPELPRIFNSPELVVIIIKTY